MLEEAVEPLSRPDSPEHQIGEMLVEDGVERIRWSRQRDLCLAQPLAQQRLSLVRPRIFELGQRRECLFIGSSFVHRVGIGGGQLSQEAGDPFGYGFEIRRPF